MKLTLTNTGNVAVPVVSEDDGGWAEALDAGSTLDLDKPTSDVWIIGDKPGVLESIEQGVKVISTMARALITAIAGRKDGLSPAAPGDRTVRVTILNHGDKPVRFIPGTVEREGDVAPGDFVELEGEGYVELRELGG